MSQYRPTERTRLRRLPDRAVYDRAQVAALLDQGFVCHVGFVVDEQPYVIPTIYVRCGNELYLHGSAASRMLRSVRAGIPVCITVTHVDGLVLARSVFHHSVNYRSVVILGTALEVTDPDERLRALEALVEHVVPGRWHDARPPSAQELKATLVIRVALEEVSAKIRSGPPVDDTDDYRLDCWAGEIPLHTAPGSARPDPRLNAGVQLPDYVRDYRWPPGPVSAS